MGKTVEEMGLENWEELGGCWEVERWWFCR